MIIALVIYDVHTPPLFASAQTTDQIQLLLNQIRDLQQQKPVAQMSFSGILTLGSRGGDELNLQTILKSQGYYTYPSVAAYQRANDLEPVGYVGPKTRQPLNRVTISTSNDISTNSNTVSYYPTPTPYYSGGGGNQPTPIPTHLRLMHIPTLVSHRPPTMATLCPPMMQRETSRLFCLRLNIRCL
jgi:hypothetical protein